MTEKVQSYSSSNISNVIKNSCNSLTNESTKSFVISSNGNIIIIADENKIKTLTSTTNTLTLVPIQTGTTPLVGTTDGGKTIAGWRCGAATDGSTIPAKYLPSSCKGNY
ncbi:pilin [Psychrobacter submarinus]|uniref:pilin n=1 Tax=Psychrobacter submarinus TaxID=154108 RepID=UPI0037097C4D